MVLYAGTPAAGDGALPTSTWGATSVEDMYARENLQQFFIDLGVNAVDVLILSPVRDAQAAYEAARNGDYIMVGVYVVLTACDLAKPCSATRMSTKALRRAARHVGPVKTPYGEATQGLARNELLARAKVQGGAPLWRVGTMGRSAAGEAQFWSLEVPSSPDFASRMGIPKRNVLHADFHESAILRPGTSFVTRSAPGVGEHTGGGIEVVVPEGGVIMRYFGTIPRP
jgi:hypothetical protein